jgi:hypothetical protein
MNLFPCGDFRSAEHQNTVLLAKSMYLRTLSGGIVVGYAHNAITLLPGAADDEPWSHLDVTAGGEKRVVMQIPSV